MYDKYSEFSSNKYCNNNNKNSLERNDFRSEIKTISFLSRFTLLNNTKIELIKYILESEFSQYIEYHKTKLIMHSAVVNQIKIQKPFYYNPSLWLTHPAHS